MFIDKCTIIRRTINRKSELKLSGNDDTLIFEKLIQLTKIKLNLTLTNPN